MGFIGVDYVMIDTEHTPICAEGIGSDLVRAADLGGLTTIMRVKENDPTVIATAFDIGCQGVFVSHIDSAEEAKRVVDAVKFPPLGERSLGPNRHRNLMENKYGMDRKQYIDYWNRESIVMILIENKKGVDNMNDILSVPGIDVVGIGQSDLSAELGAPAGRFKNPDVVKIVERLIAQARARGIAIREQFGGGDTESAIKWYNNGIRVIEWGSDVGVFQNAAKKIAKDAQILRK